LHYIGLAGASSLCYSIAVEVRECRLCDVGTVAQYISEMQNDVVLLGDLRS
jgi:hypothetical protein